MRISEAATGVGEQMADVGLAMQRAVDKTENMKARADAVSELEAAGTFDDITALGSGEDDIDRQLKQLSSQPEVDDELAKMKSELGMGPAAPAAQIPSQSQPPSRALRAPRPMMRSSRRGRRPGMIVRISGEDQYVLPRRRRRAVERDRGRGRLASSRAGDEAGLRGRATARCWTIVREPTGTPYRRGRARGSDSDPAAAGLSFEEAGREFTGEGLIPD